MFTIYTDGACSGNPGPGGWGARLEGPEGVQEIKGGEPQTTNNRMELMAVIQGLMALQRSCEVQVTSDSTYVLKGIQEWMPNWKKKGWKTAAKKPVKNADLWKQLDELVVLHSIDWQWVKGHSGHRENEIADQLANKGIDNL